MEKLFKLLIFSLFMVSWLSLHPLAAQVTSQQSIKALEKPRVTMRSRSMQKSVLKDNSVKIPNLKAVLLGAPIDGDNGTWTQSEIANLQKASAMLQQNGVEVHEFYTPNNDWEEIKKVANGAHFLLYRGHGIYDGSEPPVWVGGFGLKDKFASSDDVKNDLKLAKGAIVMLYGCFTAGNAGSDVGKIDEKEAKRRVAMYSKPFMEMGASAYYANWFGDAFEKYVSYLFEGKTVGDAYKSYSDFNAETVKYEKHPQIKTADMWIDHDIWDGKITFNNAFVGNANQSLQSLFSGKNQSNNNNNTNTTVSDGNKDIPQSTSEIIFLNPQKANGSPKTYKEVLAELKGKVVYADVWASWCSPCMGEMPYSQKMHEKFDNQEVAFLYINLDNSDEKWKRTVQLKNIKGYHYRPVPGSEAYEQLMSDFNIEGIPHFILFDKNGSVTNKDASRPSNGSTESDIRQLLNTKSNTLKPPTNIISKIKKKGEGLKAAYYVNNELIQERIDATIDFDWSDESPLETGQKEDYQVVWTGSIEPKYTENYTFYTTSDDGVILTINGINVIDKWEYQSSTEWSGEIRLEAGRKYTIEISYFQGGGAAVMKLMWESPSQPKQVVPQAQLYKE